MILGINVGRSIGTFFERYEATLRRYLDENLTPMTVLPVIEPARRPEEAVVYGCYHLAQAHLARAATAG